MILSRRLLLASLGLALPAVTLIPAEANATTAHHKKHKHHGHSVLASHKHRKPAATPVTTTQG